MRRLPRLEPYAVKVARTVLRRGGDGNAASLPDRLGESGFVVQSRRNQMTAKEKAKAGLWLLKQAVLELVEGPP